MTTFASRLLDWFDQHGRKDLPWQQRRSPYRVWVSEIMLQQTQVATVIPYYERFMRRFPDLHALADADVDEVLHLWSGLGYYARARRMHQAAVLMLSKYNGEFPRDIDAVQALPGIGRSTAGAVLSLACGQRHAILDGNVKRVLCRHGAIEGWPGSARVTATLWELAEALTPTRGVADYNQAIMDIGATICTRRRPRCGDCPLAADCQALSLSRVADLPTPRPRKQLPVRSVTMLLVREPGGGVLLERRPPHGVWGGLWGLPELATDHDPLRWCRDKLDIAARIGRRLAPRRHSFTHFHLDIEPMEILLHGPGWCVLEADTRLWYNPRDPQQLGLAAPVATLLKELDDRPRNLESNDG